MKINFFNKTEENVTNSKKLIEKVLSYDKSNAIMNIIFVSDEQIHKINKEKRGVDRVTDVISFALHDSNEDVFLISQELGDIFIDLDQARRQAESYGHSFEREVGFLATHGYLHLMGYDHMTPEEEKEMFHMQDVILEAANLKRGE